MLLRDEREGRGPAPGRLAGRGRLGGIAEPEGVLPARGLAEPRAQGGQLVVQHRPSYAATAAPLEARPDAVAEQHAQRLLDASAPEAPGGLVGQGPLDRVVGDVDRWPAVDDPLGHDAAGATTAEDAEAVHAGRDVDALHLRRRAEQRVDVGRERLRSAEEGAQTDALQAGVAPHRPLQMGRHPVPVRLDRAEGEVRGRAVEVPGRPLGLEQADQQPVGLLAVVAVAVGVLDDRQVAVHARHRLGEQVVVLRGLQGYVDPAPPRQLARPQTGGQHDRLALDLALVGEDGRRRDRRRCGSRSSTPR